ncbi:methyltransferase domain-containing protein [Acaricomes phytoseiuli]|uniref:class I SAM-dependent methyltransferase n=1 Tax=Acaricomes phytoseiuli TaxID=291968 RepID=UPI000366B57D|nr:class I SAM-dependent methyltransferase [Acaricomes phytoseiuli]MCW1249386.1 methyltransferase domain-containing protein [Acaricomes phytoseiuli]
MCSAGPKFQPERRRELAAAFQDGAERYERIRPGYPKELTDWLIPRAAKRVLELGAGTGKFTTHLVERGLDVTVTDLSAQMLAELQRQLPSVTCYPDSAESLRLADASVDAVFAAQAWHWFDVPAASREIARVLAPGGSLGLLWNQLDVREPWVHRLSRIMHAGDVLREDFRPPLGQELRLCESRSFSWLQNLSTAGVMELAKSRSYYLRATDSIRAKVLANLDWYLHEHLGWTSDSRIELPYLATAWHAVPR